MNILTFTLGGETFGVDGERVSELSGFNFNSVAQVPKQPDHVLGLMNLRGSVIPVCDLRKAFSFDDSDYGDRAICLVVLAYIHGEEKKIGLVVDHVETVTGIEVEPMPNKKLDGNISDLYMRGIATLNDELLSILDIEAIVRDKLELGVNK